MSTPGYFKAEDATRQLVDEDGWLHTGDIGQCDEDGFYVVDRKKEMIITSAGKNIAPSNIENYLKESPLVGHALVFGEGRPYCVAVLTLDGEVAPQVARQRHRVHRPRRPGPQPAGPCARAAVGRRRERAPLAARAGQEFLSCSVEWTAESEGLTAPEAKRVVHAKYQEVWAAVLVSRPG